MHRKHQNIIMNILKQMIANSKMKTTILSNNFRKVYEQSTGLNLIAAYIAIYIGLVFLITCAAVLALQQFSTERNADNIEKYQLLSKNWNLLKMINHAIKHRSSCIFVCL